MTAKSGAAKPISRAEAYKTATAKRRASEIDSGKKGRSTRTDLSEADMYDRRAAAFNAAGNHMAAGAVKFSKLSKGLGKVKTIGPRLSAKLSTDKRK